MLGRVVRDTFVFMEFQKSGGALEGALLLETALGLDLAELVECLPELAGEPPRVHAERGKGGVGGNDVKFDAGLLGGWVGGAVQEGGFEHRDAVEAPRGVGELLGEVSFGGSGGMILGEELAAVLLGCDGILGSEDGGMAGEAVGDGVLGRTLFAGGGAGSGGESRIRAVRANARLWGWGFGVGDWGRDRICHGGLQRRFSMGGWRFRARGGACCWVGGGDGCGSSVNGGEARRGAGGEVADGVFFSCQQSLASFPSRFRTRPWRRALPDHWHIMRSGANSHN